MTAFGLAGVTFWASVGGLHRPAFGFAVVLRHIGGIRPLIGCGAGRLLKRDCERRQLSLQLFGVNPQLIGELKVDFFLHLFFARLTNLRFHLRELQDALPKLSHLRSRQGLALPVPGK